MACINGFWAGWLLVCGMVLNAEENALEQAWKLAANGDRPKAIALLHNLIGREPKNPDAHLLLGSLLAEGGQRDEAIAELTDAVHLRPHSAEAQNALGETYNQFGDQRAARDSFAKAVTLNPKFGVAQENLGGALLQLAEPAAAAKHLDQAIVLLGRAPEAADAEYLRARIWMAEGNSRRAAEFLEKAIEVRPDFAEAWSDLGVARRENLNEQGALAAFKRAVDLNPQGAVAQYRLGAEYLRQGEAHLAVAALEAAYQLNPQDQSTLNSLQGALRQVGRLDDASAMKTKLTEMLRDRDVKSQNGIKALKVNNEGAALEKVGQLPEALVRYREAVELDPDHAGIRTNYAIALLRLGQWTEGLTELHAALMRDPNNADLKRAMQDALSKAPPALVPEWGKNQSARY